MNQSLILLIPIVLISCADFGGNEFDDRAEIEIEAILNSNILESKGDKGILFFKRDDLEYYIASDSSLSFCLGPEIYCSDESLCLIDCIGAERVDQVVSRWSQQPGQKADWMDFLGRVEKINCLSLRSTSDYCAVLTQESGPDLSELYDFSNKSVLPKIVNKKIRIENSLSLKGATQLIVFFLNNPSDLALKDSLKNEYGGRDFTENVMYSWIPR